jgi:1-acyl-sn-glycerol-3-phosphate acyltransferase
VKPGFLVVVRRADVPIIPVGVAGAWHAYPRGVLFPRPRTVRVVIGEPLPTALVQELSQKGRESNFVALVKDRMESSLAAAEAWLAGDLADLDSEPARGEVR